MTLQELWDQLNRHDWTYMYSDDPSVYSRGYDQEQKLKKLAKTVEKGEELYVQFHNYHFSGEHYGTKKEPKPGRPS